MAPHHLTSPSGLSRGLYTSPWPTAAQPDLSPLFPLLKENLAPNHYQVHDLNKRLICTQVRLAKFLPPTGNADGGHAMPTIKSTAIRYAEYDAASLQLRITFAKGNTYTYYGVPESVYIGLLRATSAGTYFNDHIKDRYGS